MDLSYIFSAEQPDYVLLSVFLCLLFMSLLSWTILLCRCVELLLAKRRNRIFLQDFNLGETSLHAEEGVRSALLAHLSTAAQDARSTYRTGSMLSPGEHLAQSMQLKMQSLSRPYERGLTALASIGATAPFIGLFGTVWGIYHAMINIGVSGQLTLAAVSQPIGEALIATAAGLFVAIPAVLAYNALLRANKNLVRDLQAFAGELYLRLLNGASE